MWRAGHWPTTRSTGTPSAAAWAGPASGRSCGSSTTTASRSADGQAGLLEVKPGQLGPAADWMRTTDMARIDADGFLWILGRADQAIIRGGFKVMPDDVRTALESHPAVQGAAVVGRPDDRLGETPVAMVELREAVDAAALLEYLRTRLARYEIPTEIAIVEQIPTDTVRQSRPQRRPTILQRCRRTCLRPRSPRCCASRCSVAATIRCWCATPSASATPRPTAAPPTWPAA